MEDGAQAKTALASARRADGTRGAAPTTSNSSTRWLRARSRSAPAVRRTVSTRREGVLDVAAEQVDVGDEDLGVHIVRGRGRGRAGGLEVGVRGPLQELDLRQSDPGQVVGRALQQRLLVGGTAVA